MVVEPPRENCSINGFEIGHETGAVKEPIRALYNSMPSETSLNAVRSDVQQTEGISRNDSSPAGGNGE